jgi:hypothetical protein
MEIRQNKYEQKIMQYDKRQGHVNGLKEQRKQYEIYKEFYTGNRILSNYKEQFDFIFYKIKKEQKPHARLSGIYIKCFEEFYKNVIKPNKLPIVNEYRKEVKKFMMQFMDERSYVKNHYSSKVNAWV